jgi:CubicO group peptidase (beta-lactamase class C family)
VVQRFLSRSPSSGSRALGWDTPEHDAGHHSVYGDLACASTYGHTGWTGTMFWIDPDHDLFLVFLTNRSLRPRLAHSISALADIRTRLSDLVIQIARR